MNSVVIICPSKVLIIGYTVWIWKNILFQKCSPFISASGCECSTVFLPAFSESAAEQSQTQASAPFPSIIHFSELFKLENVCSFYLQIDHWSFKCYLREVKELYCLNRRSILNRCGRENFVLHLMLFSWSGEVGNGIN